MHAQNPLKWARAKAAASIDATQEDIEALYVSYGGAFEPESDTEDVKPTKKSK